MKKTKAFICVVVAVLMMTSCFFVSCGTGDDKPTDAVTVQPKNENEETYFIPETKYNAEITILCPNNDSEWSCNDFYQETDSQDPVPNAVYQRNNLIENTFGVTIKTKENVSRTSINQYVMNSYNSGDMDYDIVMQTVNRCYTLAQSGYLMNLDDVENLDLTSEAWDQSYLAQTSIGNQNYFATGEITTMDNDATWVMMFNKKLAEKRNLSDMYDGQSIYDLVKAGKWTMDTLLAMAKDVYEDTDNNGQISSGDSFGIATTIDFIQGLFYGANAKLVVKDDNDEPQLSFYNKTNLNVIEKIIEIYYSANKVTFDCHDYISENPQAHLIAQEMFESDRALFYSEVMQCVIRLREMDTDFGIIPVPKFSETQKNYTTHSVADVTLCCCFPKILEKDSSRVAMSGAIAQALAVEGKNILTPAYYERSIIGKGARDDESLEMLEIIFKNRTADLGYITGNDDISSLMSGMRSNIKAGKSDLASLVRRYESRVKRALVEMTESFENVD